MKPGYREIYQRYRQNIHDGVLKPGDRVPSIRLLANHRRREIHHSAAGADRSETDRAFL